MNLDELVQAARTALREEFATYDPAAGRARLADDAISDAADFARHRPAPSREDRPSSWVENWSALAACRSTDPDELFVQGAGQARAKTVCTGCPVRTECLADALDNRVEFGVWGGMTERERRALLRRRPSITSWRRLLETARAEYEAGDCRSSPLSNEGLNDIVDQAI